MISVIVPIYKVEQYLVRCIESLINQTYTNIEIILVDDGSPDKCGEICEVLAKKDSRIIVIHQKNKGLSGARNTGLSVARGEYIGFVDSDDAVSAHFLEILADALELHNADISVCDRVDIYDEQIPLDKTEDYSITCFSREKATEYLVKNKIIYQTVWNKLYKRDIIKNLLFEEGKLHEDEFFTWKALQNCNQIVHASAPLYYYFHREGSIMETFSKKRLDFFQARYERHLFILQNYPELITESKNSIEFPCVLMMQKLLKNKNKQLRREAKPILHDCYEKCKFTKEELKSFPARYRINFDIANISLELCAWLRNVLGRNS